MRTILALVLLSAGAARAADDVEIRVLSNRADLISGGDALVELVAPQGADASRLRVKVGERDVTGSFAVRANGRTMGRIEGMALGENLVTAQLPEGRGARITITNHSVGGPIFSGTQIQPWVCSTAENGLGAPLDAQCNAPARVQFLYMSTGGGGFQPYDAANPPSDVATTTTDQGHTVPYIIREETGAMNRGIYKTAILYDPAKPFEPWERQKGWNGKLYYLFGASCGTSHTQAFAENVRFTRALSRGFAVASSSMNVLGNSCNTVASAETAMMVKARLIEQFGEIRYTMSKGGSGGSIGQHVVANAYPGLVDGIVPEASYEDVWTAVNEVNDCHLLVNYFTRTSPHFWASPQQQAAVTGHASIASCIAWEASFAPVGDPRNGCNAGNDYHPQDNPGGCRGTLQDYHLPQLGPRPQDGFARWPYDNVGRMYGLVALRKGQIAPEQFVDLNEKVGGVDIDNNFVPQRKSADPGSVLIVHRGGLLNDGAQLNRVPIIDVRATVPGDAEIHTSFHSFAMRARLEKAHGHAGNHVIFHVAEVPNLPSNVGLTTFTLMDRWLSAIEADTSGDPLSVKVVRNKPVDAVDTCIIQNQLITDPTVCGAAFPHYADPLIAAGGPFTNDIMKCQLKRLEPADVAVSPVPFTLDQFMRLQRAFPEGVCDWSKPGEDQVRSEPWTTFAEGPGGRPLGDAPRSEPFHIAPDLAAGAISMSRKQVNGSDQVTFSAVATNTGNAEASAVVVRFLVDGERLGADQTIASLAANASLNVASAVWSARHQGGSHTVQVVLDPAGAIAEASESNNSATATFVVQGNKIRNGSFEQTSNGSSPDAWTSSGPTSYESGSVRTQPGGSWSSEPVAVTPGASYMASLQVAGSGGTFVIQQFAPDGTMLAAMSLPLPITTVVESVGMTVAVLAGAAQLRVVLVGGTLGQTTFDNVELR